MFERQHLRFANDVNSYPAPDLAESLVNLYFENVHPYDRIIHEGEFMRDYKRGLAEDDRSFRSLCYAIFAVASRFSSDIRVMSPVDELQVNRQASGALYSISAGSLLTPSTLPCTLFDLQSMAILSYFIIGTSTPTTAWLTVGMFLRKGRFHQSSLICRSIGG